MGMSQNADDAAKILEATQAEARWVKIVAFFNDQSNLKVVAPAALRLIESVIDNEAATRPVATEVNL